MPPKKTHTHTHMHMHMHTHTHTAQSRARGSERDSLLGNAQELLAPSSKLAEAAVGLWHIFAPNFAQHAPHLLQR